MRTTRINTFIAKDGMANELHEFLTSIISVITQLPGCESCNVLHRQDDAHELVIIETWTSVAAHQAAAQTIPPEKIAMLMPLLSKPPSGAYYLA
jgi:quinol monooxygenase YgiN